MVGIIPPGVIPPGASLPGSDPFFVFSSAIA